MVRSAHSYPDGTVVKPMDRHLKDKIGWGSDYWIPVLARKTLKVILVLLAIAVYLNVGWAVEHYYRTYIVNNAPQTFWQTVWKGGFEFFTTPGPVNTNDPGFSLIIIFWLVLPIISLVSWFVYGIYYLSIGLWHTIWFVLWLLYRGGIAKLLGIA